MDYSLFISILKHTITLAALVDPFLMIPIYIKLTEDLSIIEKNIFSRKVATMVFFVLVICTILGKQLFDILGLSIDALRVAGGFFLFSMGTAMLFGHEMNAKGHGTEEDLGNLRLVPLAVPLLAGPASISYIMTQKTTFFYIDILSSIAIVCIIVWLVFKFASPISQKIRKSYLAIIERLSGLIVTVMSIEIFAKGLKGIFPILNSTI